MGGFFKLWEGGLVAYGGYLGGVITAYLGFRRVGVDFWRFSEHAAG